MRKWLSFIRVAFDLETTKLLKFFSVLSISCITWVSYSKSDEAVWTLKQEHADCFLKSVENYAHSKLDPVVIYLEACPIVDRERAVQAIQKNSALPSIPHKLDESVDTIIVYSIRELNCLAQFKADMNNNHVLLPKRPKC